MWLHFYMHATAYNVRCVPCIDARDSIRIVCLFFHCNQICHSQTADMFSQCALSLTVSLVDVLDECSSEIRLTTFMLVNYSSCWIFSLEQHPVKKICCHALDLLRALIDYMSWVWAAPWFNLFESPSEIERNREREKERGLIIMDLMRSHRGTESGFQINKQARITWTLKNRR